MLMRNRRDFSDIDKCQSRVGRRFDPNKLRFGANEFSDIDLNARTEGDFHIVCKRYFGEVAVGSTIDIRDRYNMRSCGERLKDVGCGGGTRTESECVSCVLEGCDSALKVITRNILGGFRLRKHHENVPIRI